MRFLSAEVCKEGTGTFLGHSSASWPQAFEKNSPWSAIPPWMQVIKWFIKDFPGKTSVGV